MIKLCRILDAVDGSHVGYYVNGGVMYEETVNGRVMKTCCKYDSNKHIICEEGEFNAKMVLWRKFYYETKRLCPKFSKSRYWDECITIRLLFGMKPIFYAHLDQMKIFNVVTVDGRYLRLGEVP